MKQVENILPSLLFGFVDGRSMSLIIFFHAEVFSFQVIKFIGLSF